MNEKERVSQTGGPSRRAVLRVIGAAPAIATGAAIEAEAQTAKPASAAAGYKRKIFDDRQWHTVRVLCDLILPADEHSGSATQAGVPEFMDDWIDFRRQEDGNDRLMAEILGGLAWIDRESYRLFQKAFADAAPEQQKQILDRIAWPERAHEADRPWVAFFNSFRDLTVGGFYSSRVGVADLPYLGNKAVMEWKGCDPKIWAEIEDRMKNGYKAL